MKCIHCNGDLDLKMSLMATEKMSVAINFEGVLIDAATIGSLLLHTQKCLKETARCLGSKRTEVFVTEMKLTDKQFSAELFVTCADGVNAESIVQTTNQVIKAIVNKNSEASE